MDWNCTAGRPFSFSQHSSKACHLELINTLYHNYMYLYRNSYRNLYYLLLFVWPTKHTKLHATERVKERWVKREGGGRWRKTNRKSIMDSWTKNSNTCQFKVRYTIRVDRATLDQYHHLWITYVPYLSVRKAFWAAESALQIPSITSSPSSPPPAASFFQVSIKTPFYKTMKLYKHKKMSYIKVTTQERKYSKPAYLVMPWSRCRWIKGKGWGGVGWGGMGWAGSGQVSVCQLVCVPSHGHVKKRNF